MKDQALPWDFYYLYHIGRNTNLDTPQNEILTDTTKFKIDLNPGRNLHFHSYIKLNEDEYVRLAFFIEEMEEKLCLTKYVVDFLTQKGVITTAGVFPLLGKDIEYKLSNKNCISSKFLHLTQEEGPIKTRVVDGRESKTQTITYTIVGYKILNSDNNGINITKDKSIDLK